MKPITYTHKLASNVADAAQELAEALEYLADATTEMASAVRRVEADGEGDTLTEAAELTKCERRAVKARRAYDAAVAALAAALATQ